MFSLSGSDMLASMLHADNTGPVTGAEAAPHGGDLALARSILAGDEPSWQAFLHSYHPYIERTAMQWCHRGVPARVCRLCKPHAHDVEQGCDAFSDAYAYILERFRSAALAAYGGRTALRSFVYLCLHDFRWWASHVQRETGKIKLPKILANESRLIQQVYQRLCWEWDNDRIARELKTPLGLVEQARATVEDKLRSAGRSIVPRRIKTTSLSDLYPDDDEEVRTPEPAAEENNPEVRSEALAYWSRLSVQDRTLLRLVVESGKSKREIAAALGVTLDQVYNSIYRIRKEMPEWFKMQAEPKKSRPGSVQSKTEEDDE